MSGVGIGPQMAGSLLKAVEAELKGMSPEAQKLKMQTEGEQDRQASASKSARDFMEQMGMNPGKLIGGLLDVFKSLISGSV